MPTQLTDWSVSPRESVLVAYDLQTASPIAEAAERLAGEQSTGTFTRVARETAELRSRHAATVVSIDELEPRSPEALPGTRGDWASSKRARVVLEFPLHNFGPSLPNLLSTIAGNLFEMRDVGALKIVDLALPTAFSAAYPGPAFGVAGTRRLMAKPAGPLLGTIVKPSIGLDTESLRALVLELALAGIDFIKDDELQSPHGASPLSERVPAVMSAIHEAAEATGKTTMYAFNITDDVHRLRANHDLVLAAGGTCVMACVNSIGLAGTAYLREISELPVHGHRAGAGAFSRSPLLGWSITAFQKLARLAGVDHFHTNGISNKFYESDAEVLAAIEAVRAPLFGGYETLPVLSSGQTAGLAPATLAATGTEDLLVLAGGGIHGHPDGAAAGVHAMRHAWEAATSGEPLAERARREPSLARALEVFGRAPEPVRGGA